MPPAASSVAPVFGSLSPLALLLSSPDGMGTSLRVQPFASLVGRVPPNCPRLLINREEVGQANPMLENLGLRDPSALDFSEFNTRDAAYLGDCDGGVRARSKSRFRGAGTGASAASSTMMR